jgi:DnaA family protein
MEQLIFELATPEPPAFANFVQGRNVEAWATLRRFAAGECGDGETGIVLWGAPGAGKTHLLRAAVGAAEAAGRDARYVAKPADVTAAVSTPHAFIAVDQTDSADAAAQGRLFTLYNALAASHGQLAVATRSAPATLALRDDLRTRLGHGLIFEIAPLADADKASALAIYARERGFRLGNDVIGYLLAHGRRDMGSLVATLAALDRRSLSEKRPITVPLLREWLRREAGARTPD